MQPENLQREFVLTTENQLDALLARWNGLLCRVMRKSLRILLVEDHEDTRQIFQLILRQKGHSVQSAATGEGALALASSQAFDLVISDLGLPDVSGTDLMSILRERYSLRGVAVSGYGMEEDIQRSKSAGFDHHLTKPADPAKIDQLLAAIMREIRLQRTDATLNDG